MFVHGDFYCTNINSFLDSIIELAYNDEQIHKFEK